MRSHETMILLQVMKQMHTEIAELRAEVRAAHSAIERMEQTGLTLNITGIGGGGLASEGVESESESGSESGALSAQSAP